MEAIEEQEKKEKRQRVRESRDVRENGLQGRRLTRYADERSEKVSKTVEQEEEGSFEEVVECRRPNLRARKQKRMNIVSSS